MIQINWEPGSRMLRQFGWICLVGFGVLGALIAHRSGCFEGSGQWTWPGVLWGLGGGFWLLGMVAPRALKFVYIGMTMIAFPIGLVVGTVIMLLLFFLVFTPLALWFKIIGRDVLHRRLDPEAESYWVEFEEGRGAESYYRQF